MISQLTLRVPKKLIELLKNRAGSENISVNALTERFIEHSLQSSAPQDEFVQLSTDPDQSLRQVYRKITGAGAFGPQALTAGELRWFFHQVREALISPGELISPQGIETALHISCELAAAALENQLTFDEFYVRRELRVQAETCWADAAAQCLGSLRPDIEALSAEFLLRPLASQAFPLERYPAECLAQICTPARLKKLLPLAVRQRRHTPEQRDRFAQETGQRMPDLIRKILAGGLSVELWLAGNQTAQADASSLPGPRFALTVGDGRFLQTYDWLTFSCLWRLFRARSAADQYHARSWQSPVAGIYFPEADNAQVVMTLGGLRLFLTWQEYSTFETEFLALVSAPDVAPVLERLRILFGDL